MEKEITISKLFNFIPLNDNEKKIFDFDKDIIRDFKFHLDNGIFYLGGQFKMRDNDLINLDTIEAVRLMDRIREIEYGEPYNSFEAASIIRNRIKLSTVENMIIKYNEIMELRVKEELNKTNFNNDI